MGPYAGLIKTHFNNRVAFVGAVVMGNEIQPGHFAQNCPGCLATA